MFLFFIFCFPGQRIIFGLLFFLSLVFGNFKVVFFLNLKGKSLVQ